LLTFIILVNLTRNVEKFCGIDEVKRRSLTRNQAFVYFVVTAVADCCTSELKFRICMHELMQQYSLQVESYQKVTNR